MIPYQFPNAVTIDLEALVAIDEVLWINASINAHSDWSYGEYYYELVFKFAEHKIRRYSRYEEREKLEVERNQLMEDWKNGISRCLVVSPG